MLTSLLTTIGIIDGKSKKYSYTSVAFITGFAVINIKLLFSGFTINSYKFAEVTISDWATGVAALSAMRIANKHVNNIQINKQSSNTKQE